MRIRTPLIAGLLAALMLAGCSGDTEGGDATASAEAPADTAGDGFHGADIAFLQGMIPHHAEAVEMARLVQDRSERAPLHDLAGDIISSQEAEIEQMEQLLEQAGVSHDAGAGQAPGGMMDPDGLERLAGLQGTEFDLAFVDSMIEHHEGAIESAEQVIDVGQHPQVRQLADGIIVEQRAEIERMRAWRDLWAREGA